jgi:hypothetical protein
MEIFVLAFPQQVSLIPEASNDHHLPTVSLSLLRRVCTCSREVICVLHISPLPTKPPKENFLSSDLIFLLNYPLKFVAANPDIALDRRSRANLVFRLKMYPLIVVS